jgi:1,2-dihydroxy-3-keto-5-methylthiopentene dioxygenase
MALVRIPEENRSISDAAEVSAYLGERSIDYEKWTPSTTLPIGAPAEAILAAYGDKIDALKAQGGYVTADVIDVHAETPNLETMLAKFRSEHWHDEDEVRLIVEGRGLFHVHPPNQPVFAIEVEAGDCIRVPRGTHHWFDLCGDRRIRAIRLFQDMSGWTPHYTSSGVDSKFQPLCFGPSYIPPSKTARAIDV